MQAIMTEKQIEKVRLSIKTHRAALAAEKRKFGGFDDSAGRRYYISDLYIKISDYKGAITYKKWFDKNFPDDSGGPLLSLNWAIAYYSLGQITESKIYTIDTAFKNLYLHGFILDNKVDKIDVYEPEYDMYGFAKSLTEHCKKVVTQPYYDWLSAFINSDEYKEPLKKYISLHKQLKDENNTNKRGRLLDQIKDLKYRIKAENHTICPE
jgi:hypothetical protein